MRTNSYNQGEPMGVYYTGPCGGHNLAVLDLFYQPLRSFLTACSKIGGST